MQGATNDLELLRIRLHMQPMLEDLSSLPTNACLAENINVHFCCLANHDCIYQFLGRLTLTAEGDNIWQYKPPTNPLPPLLTPPNWLLWYTMYL